MSHFRKVRGNALPADPPPPLASPTPPVPAHRAATAVSTNRTTSAIARLTQPFSFMAPSRPAISSGHAQYHQSAESLGPRDAGRVNETLMSSESNEGVEPSFHSPTLYVEKYQPSHMGVYHPHVTNRALICACFPPPLSVSDCDLYKQSLIKLRSQSRPWTFLPTGQPRSSRVGTS